MIRLILALFTITTLASCQLVQLYAADDAKPLVSADNSDSVLTAAQPVVLTPVRSERPLHEFTVAQQAYADEDKDFATPLFTSLIPNNWNAMTPTLLPGAKRLTTYELWKLLKDNNQPIVINVLAGSRSEVIADSVWLSGAGRFGRMDDDIQQRLAEHLQRLTGNNRQRPLIFYCQGISCWASFNAGQRALALGYRQVYWYRGGLRAWYAAGLPTTATTQDLW